MAIKSDIGVAPRFIRKPEHDKRIAHGDDWAGDAWLDTEDGELTWTQPGHRPEEYQQQKWPGDSQ